MSILQDVPLPSAPPPSIGRIVHYLKADLTVSPAIVIAVPGSGAQIVLGVFGRRGYYVVEGVTYGPNGDMPETWRWPPRVEGPPSAGAL